MVVLGLVLVLLALLLGAALIAGTSAPGTVGQDIDIHLLDTVTFTLDPLTLVVAGMLVMFLLWLGMVLIKTTLARKARLRRERKAAELEARDRHRREEIGAAEHTRHEEGKRRLGEERRAGGSTAVPLEESTATSSTDETRPLPREGTGGSTRPFTRRPGGPGERTSGRE